MCHRCGAPSDAGPGAVPLGWSTSQRDGRIEAICDRCTRAHVRDIEGKLDEDWWSVDGRG